MLAEATGLWARLLLDLGKRQQAEQLAAKLEQWPENAHLLLARGRIRLALGQPEKALADFLKAIDFAPKYPADEWRHLERANAYQALKQDDKSLVELSSAVELWPKKWDTWVWRGNFHRDRQQWTEAIADYSKALELNLKFQPGWQARGTAQYRAGDWEGAIVSLTKSTELPKGGDAYDWFYLGMSQWKLDQKEKARQSYDRAVQWMEKHAAQREELRPLRAEAAELLGLGKKKD